MGWGTASWGVLGVGNDIGPPIVVIVSPAASSRITRNTELVFRITDDTGFRRLLPMIQFMDGRYEVIHDHEGFTPDYIGSIRTAIAGGYEYRVARLQGWPEPPPNQEIEIKLIPFAFDLGGNETS